MTPAERLRLARERSGYASGSEAARALGVGIPSYLSHENGTRGIPAGRAELYARRFKVSLDWLLTGKGSAPESGHIQPALLTLPVLGEAQAGAWKEVANVEEASTERVPVPDDSRIPGSRQFWIRVIGDSVDKRIPSGSLALCCDVWDWARDAADLLARADGKLVVCQRERAGLYETTIKELRVRNGKAELWPASHNPKHNGPVPLGDTSDTNGVSIVAVVTDAMVKL